MRVAADLRAAAEVLRRDGWTKGTFTDACGSHCVAGALSVVVGTGIADRWRDGIELLCQTVGVKPWPTNAYHWNDEPGRTADEVIAALLAAADAAEATS